MPSFTRYILLLVLAITVSAFTTPRFAHRRHAMAARDSIPVAREPVTVNHPRPAEPVARRKMQAVRRKSCKPRPVSSSSITSKSAAATTSAHVVGNLGEPAPTTTSDKTTATSSAAHTSSEHSSTKEPPSTKAEPTSTKIATSSSKAKTATSTSVKATSTNTGGASYLEGVQTGQGTYFATGLGACGITNTDEQNIVAVSQLLFDSYPGYNGANPNENPVCGKKITATYQGKSVSVTVTDRCVACKITDLDFTPHAFDQIAEAAIGRISGMTWVWED